MNPSPEWIFYAKVPLALLVVIGLIFLCAAAVKKAGLDKRLRGSRGGPARLVIVETLYLDPKHRLVLVRSDAKEHLLLVGVSGPLLIESREKDTLHAS